MLLFIEVSLIKDLDFKGFLHYPIVRSIFFFKNKKSVETEKSLIKDTNFRCFLHQDHHCQLFSKNKHEGSVAKGKNKCKMTRGSFKYYVSIFWAFLHPTHPPCK